MKFKIYFTQDNLLLCLLLTLGLLLRLAIYPYFTHFSDMALWQYWGQEISRLGFKNFFDLVSWTDYLPFYFYILYLLHQASLLIQIPSDLLFKLPAIIADLVTAVFIYLIFNKSQLKQRLTLVSLYLFNPAIFANSALWGQVDGIGVMLMVGSVLFLQTNNFLLLALFLAISILFKPLYLFGLFTFLLILFLNKKRDLVKFLAYLFLFTFLITLPFSDSPLDVPALILNRYLSSVSQYQYAGVNAFNFWGFLDLNWVPDTIKFFNVSYHIWGLAIFLFILLFNNLQIFLARTTRYEPKTVISILAVTFLGLFTFATRAHERHMLTGLGLLSLLVLENRLIFLSYIALSILYLFNLYFGLEYLMLNGKFVFNDFFVRSLSLVSTLITSLLFLKLWISNLRPNNHNACKKYLFFILLAALLLRFYRLDYPKAYVFDEVYHGFTAVEYTKWSAAAWEWWTTPPKGVAYEWTHPPLAKEIMTASLKIFSTSSPWGWRVPGALLGVVSVYLIYLIGRKLFDNERAALISAFVFSVDGLNFVQSRTGMNDIYLVTFLLGSIYFFLDKRFFLSSLFLGLAIASKWTGVYLYAFYILLCFYDFLKSPRTINLRKVLLASIMFLSIPASVYLISYAPFFLLGHSWDQFLELQRQMWHYHTNLKATHDYSSPWWSWPLNLYPVWYYVQYFSNETSNIFASGNPMMFWLGFASIITSCTDYFKKHSRSIFIIILGYLTFILPWSVSPRIMFLYHYSPCIPFLSLCLGFQLEKVYLLNRTYFYVLLGLIVVGFVLIYPFLTGISLPKGAINLFFNTNLAKNPF